MPTSSLATPIPGGTESTQYDFQKGWDDNFPFSDKVNSVLKGKQKIKKPLLLSAFVPWWLALCCVIHRPQGSPRFNCSCLAPLEMGKREYEVFRTPFSKLFFLPFLLRERGEEIWKLMNKRMSSIYPLARQNIDIHSANRSCQSPFNSFNPVLKEDVSSGLLFIFPLQMNQGQ